jgi:hypothetical protein
MKKLVLTITLLAASNTFACAFYARGAEDYRKATRKVLDTREEKIQDCYEDTLKKDKNAKGEVVLQLLVQKKTGDFTEVKVTGDAPEALKTCVEEAVKGLQLTPPDERDGHGQFTYRFKKKK